MSVSWIRPRQLIVWLLLLSLVASIVVVEGTGLFESGPERDGHGHVVGQARMLLPVPLYDLGAVEVTMAGTVHRFQRDGLGAWFYHAHAGDAGSEGAHSHQTDPEAAERIEAALATFGRARIERELPPGERVGEYGVTAPRMVITIYPQFESAPIESYAVGHVAPDTVSRYVMAIDGSGVVTVPNYQIENLLALIEVASRDPGYGWSNRSSPDGLK
jgi:Domain of unknown function (DUF4340)